MICWARSSLDLGFRGERFLGLGFSVLDYIDLQRPNDLLVSEQFRPGLQGREVSVFRVQRLGRPGLQGRGVSEYRVQRLGSSSRVVVVVAGGVVVVVAAAAAATAGSGSGSDSGKGRSRRAVVVISH